MLHFICSFVNPVSWSIIQYVSVGKCILVPGKNHLPELIEFSGIPPSNLPVVEKRESST